MANRFRKEHLIKIYPETFGTWSESDWDFAGDLWDNTILNFYYNIGRPKLKEAGDIIWYPLGFAMFFWLDDHKIMEKGNCRAYTAAKRDTRRKLIWPKNLAPQYIDLRKFKL